jgi:hypothetical protein
VCVVFISKFDIFGGNHSLYHVDRVVRETGIRVDNGFEEIYVNTKIKDGSEVSELMEVFVDDTTYNDKFPKTSDIKHRYKETEGGIQAMCEILEKLVLNERELINKLNSILIDAGRYDDLKRSTNDPEYQSKLIAELLPNEVSND